MKTLAALLTFLLAFPSLAQQSPAFLVSFDQSVQESAARGRVIVYLIREDAGLRRAEPADGPFFSNPQPMFSADATGLRPGEVLRLDDENAEFFPVLPSELEPGRYRVQAVLDQRRQNSSWRREPGNLSSEIETMVVTERGVRVPTHLRLTEKVHAPDPAQDATAGVHFIRIRSERLSEWRGRDVYLNAGVIEPVDYDPKRRYPVVYEVPGFGGDHQSARRTRRWLHSAPADSPAGELARSAFWVVLDPEGPNGHHLFADSANNGPVGEALVKELIPAIDAAFSTIPESSARLLRGHSSGGWSTIWLLMTYPETFGATWSTSPDPVDFSSFQALDIYTEPNAYRYDDMGEVVWRTSYSDAEGTPGMTIRDENRMEEVLGPGNTSAQQWDSWLAVFGPRTDAGTPANLFDPMTGAIDGRVAKHYEKYDIVRRLRRDAPKLGPVLKERLHLVVGDMDNYDLDEAVVKLRSALDAMTFAAPEGGFGGYIEVIPGADHSSVHTASVVRDFPRQMLQYLTQQGHCPLTVQTERDQ